MNVEMKINNKLQYFFLADIIIFIPSNLKPHLLHLHSKYMYERSWKSQWIDGVNWLAFLTLDQVLSPSVWILWKKEKAKVSSLIYVLVFFNNLSAPLSGPIFMSEVLSTDKIRLDAMDFDFNMKLMELNFISNNSWIFWILSGKKQRLFVRKMVI